MTKQTEFYSGSKGKASNYGSFNDYELTAADEEMYENFQKAVLALSAQTNWKIVGALGSVVQQLQYVKFQGQSAVYIANGRRQEMLQKVTGCKTAFMISDPAQICVMHDFLKTLTAKGMLFVLLHEAGHFVFRHSDRRLRRDSGLWNIVGDLLINRILREETLPALFGKSNPVDPKEFFKTEKDYLNLIGYTRVTSSWVQLYRSYSEEEAYADIMKVALRQKQLNQPGQGGGGQGQGQGGGGQGQGQGQGQGGGQPGPSDGISQNDFNDAYGDMEEHVQSGYDIRQRLIEEYGEEGRQLADDMGFPATEAEAKKQQAETGVMLQRAQQQASGLGSHIDSYMQEAIARDADARAQLQYRSCIQGIITAAQKGRLIDDWKKNDELALLSRIPQVRQQMGMQHAIKIPLLKRKAGICRILCIMDTSGSVTADEMRKNFLNEMRAMMLTGNVILTIVSADTVSRGKVVLTSEDIAMFDTGIDIGGGGGTDMLTPLGYELTHADDKFHAAVVLSDGGYNPFTYQVLTEEMEKHADTITKKGHKPGKIPPILFLNTREHMFNREFEETLSTFPSGKARAFLLMDGEPNATISFNNKGMGVN